MEEEEVVVGVATIVAEILSAPVAAQIGGTVDEAVIEGRRAADPGTVDTGGGRPVVVRAATHTIENTDTAPMEEIDLTIAVVRAIATLLMTEQLGAAVAGEAEKAGQAPGGVQTRMKLSGGVHRPVEDVRRRGPTNFPEGGA
eukprot:GHVU01167066.1.p2 GENE.GHVU01167066.1~~GHVU01167066.1.p2  ORF type:complete len:142 (+),score=28.11 GHVU01167066.1:365-790(+)